MSKFRSPNITHMAPFLAVLFVGCASFELGYTDAYYQRRLLRVSSADGEKRLALEKGHDQRLRGYVASNGAPDYLYPVNQYETYFIYVSPERCVRFNRSALWAHSKITELSRVPPELRSSIPEFAPKSVAEPEESAPEPDSEANPAPAPRPPPSVRDDTWVGEGTGFCTSPTEIVTAYHVVASAKTIEAKFGDEDWTRVTLFRQSPSTDVAILKIPKPRKRYLVPVRKHGTLSGDRVFTLGFPAVELLGREAKYTEGVVSSLSGIGNDSCLLQVTVPIQPGNSGGPLVREDGVLVGMITSTAAVVKFVEATGSLPQNVNWAVKVDYILPLVSGGVGEKQDGTDRQTLLELVSSSVCRLRTK